MMAVLQLHTFRKRRHSGSISNKGAGYIFRLMYPAPLLGEGQDEGIYNQTVIFILSPLPNPRPAGEGVYGTAVRLYEKSCSRGAFPGSD